MKVKSAFRCEAENEKVGGGRKSFHISGRAAHVYVDGMTPQELFKKAREIPEVKGLGLNLDDGTVHIDLRNDRKSGMGKRERQIYPSDRGQEASVRP